MANNAVLDGLSTGLVAADPPRFANEDALQEIHRVLSPGGAFGMIWVLAPYGRNVCPSADSKIHVEY